MKKMVSLGGLGTTASLWIVGMLAQPSQPAGVAAAQSNTTVAERLGYPPTARLLVLHADDFGMLHSVNRATIEALNNKSAAPATRTDSKRERYTLGAMPASPRNTSMARLSRRIPSSSSRPMRDPTWSSPRW